MTPVISRRVSGTPGAAFQEDRHFAQFGIWNFVQFVYCNYPVEMIIYNQKEEREVIKMAHLEWIKATYKVLACEGNSILFEAEGEVCCEINGTPFSCASVEEFHELVEFFGDETFEE